MGELLNDESKIKSKIKGNFPNVRKISRQIKDTKPQTYVNQNNKKQTKNHTITNYRLMKKKQMNCLESKMIKMQLKAKTP